MIRANNYSVKCKPEETMKCDCEQSCDTNCINRQTFIECSPNICSFEDSCTNNKIQKGSIAPLQVFDTENKGFGVRATKFIQKNSFIIEYIGEIISKQYFEERLRTIYSMERHDYCMQFQNGNVIDAYRQGNMSRFINHSCTPNCEIEKWMVNGLSRMALFAKQDIQAGCELSFDYKFWRYNSSENEVCYCGSINCLGVIGRGALA